MAHMGAPRHTGDPRWKAIVRHWTSACDEGEPCGFCGLPIDTRLPRTDPMGLQIDHIVPVIKAPDREFELENTQPAHAICNQRAGAKDGGEAIAAGLYVTRDWFHL